MSQIGLAEVASYDQEIGRRVHHLMWDQRLTQTTLASRLGMGQSALGKKIRGEQGWSADQIVAVARALQVSVGYLFGEGDGRPAPAPEALTRNPKYAGSPEVVKISAARSFRSGVLRPTRGRHGSAGEVLTFAASAS